MALISPAVLCAALLLSCVGVTAESRVTALAEALQQPDLAQRVVLGEASDGTQIEALVLGRDPADWQGRRGLLLVAGLDGRRAADGELLRALVERLDAREDLAERLGDEILIVVPLANPAGARGLELGGPRWPIAGNGAPDDRDRDGLVDEDGPSDLDGDGRIGFMRVPDPEGEWVIDEHDPRALRAPAPEKGERGTHAVYIEGLDEDADGSFHEDPGAGIFVDRNFTHGWQEHEAGTGRYPLEAPEAKLLADLLLQNRGLIGVLVVGESDTLAAKPEVDKSPSKRGSRYMAPLKGLLEADADTLAELGTLLDEAAEGEHELKGSAPQDGSLLAWAYHEAGRWPLGLVAWEVPEDFPPEEPEEKEEGEEDDDGGEDSAADAAEGADEDVDDDVDESELRDADDAREAADGDTDAPADTDADPADDDAEPADSDEASEPDEADEPEDPKPTSDPDSPVPAALLAWLDAKTDGAAVIPWTPFEHPELGPVEIGGVLPDAKLEVRWDAEAQAALAERLAGFTLDLLDRFPALDVEALEVEQRAPGVWSVSLDLVNIGRLPTAPRFGADIGVARPLRVRLALPDGAERLAGPREVLVDRLDGLGGRRELRWILAGAASGDRLILEVDADTVADLRREIVLP